MCLGNRAQVSSHYINRQLGALWENGETCAKKHGTGLKNTHVEVEYGTCLYEFFGPGKHVRKGASKEDLSFYALFGTPRLEFVCNHEVVLFLNIKEGHYNLDTSKSQTKKYLERITDYTLAYRLDFNIASIEGFGCKLIGNADKYTLDLFILDTATATFCPEFSTVAGIDVHDRKITALDHYITAYYLPVVKRAGHHVLHSLPDFDNLMSTTAHIDYSVISTRTLATRELHGIRVDDVNAYLRGLWLQAASHVDEHGADAKDGGVHKGYLAEHKSSWTQSTEDVNFHILFGPMEVQALCKREVVVYIDIQDIAFHVGGGFDKQPQHRFSNWKLALIVDVAFEQDDTGNVRRLKLDLGTARFCENLSTMEGSATINSDVFYRLRTTLTRYISKQYLGILQASGDHQVYHHDKRIHVITDDGGPGTTDSPDEESEDDDCYCVGECTCAAGGAVAAGPGNGVLTTTANGEKHWERIQWGSIDKARVTETTTAAYDQITATTQGAVNLHFTSIWSIAQRKARELSSKVSWTVEEVLETCLAQFYYATGTGDERVVYFESSFEAPQMQLLCSQASSKTVVLYLQMLDGKMKTLDRAKGLVKGGEDIHFGGWRVAFEVPLKLEDCSDKRPAPADLMKRLNRTAHNTFKQLVLDMSNAKFSLARSSIPGLLDGKSSRLIRDKHNALIHYLTAFYLPTLVNAGHDVLYTIPMSDGTPNSASQLTSLSFQIVPFTVGKARSWVEGLFGRQRGLFDRNQIVFTGMCGGKPLPAGPSAALPGGNWVGGGLAGGKDAVQHGTVCLSRKVFLEGKILALFGRINRETTVLPAFSGIQADGEWLLKLTTWEKHEVKRNMACKWKELKTSEDSESLEFEWKNREEWRYEHEGDEGSNGWYNVTCTTRNTLSVPVVHLHDGSFAIVMHGLVDLALAYSGEGKNWSTKMQAKWAVAINFVSDANKGLTIHTSPAKIVPEFIGSHESGTIGHSTFATAFTDLKKQLPTAFDFSRVVHELHASLDGAQSQFYVKSKDQILVNPTFNRQGDLLVELQVRGAALPTVQAAVSASSAGNGQVASNGNGRPQDPKHRRSWIKQVKSKVGEVFQQSRGSVVLSTPSVSTSSLSRMSSRKSSYMSATSSSSAKGSNGSLATPTGTPTAATHSIYESDEDVA